MLPVLFVAHGSPMLAVEQNEYTEFLAELGRSLPRPKAILLFSAHWESDVQLVSAAPQPETIYDFGGFPRELYTITYTAPGDPELARRAGELLAGAGIQTGLHPNRGFDHGAWVPLRHLFPEADIPVVTLSVNQNLSPAEWYKIGQAVAPLREEGILIIGSGVTVHNFRALDWNKMDDPTPMEWAAQFEAWIAEKLAAKDLEALFAYEKEAPNGTVAAPRGGREHFAPLLYAFGAANGTDAKLLHLSWRAGSLSHSVYQFGA
jgi:4,5-DOPA dioxygenase extradiol